MKPSKNCIDLIKQFEGISLKAYKCPAGRWTIGYGSTRWQDKTPVKEGEVCTIQQAEELLQNDVNFIAARLPNNKLNQNQLDAVCSFIYNVGMANFINSTMWRYMRENHNDIRIGLEFKKWVKARVNGELKTLRGLVRRREAEAKLYYEKI